MVKMISTASNCNSMLFLQEIKDAREDLTSKGFKFD